MLAIGAIVSPNINANDGTRKKVEDICGQFPE